MNDPTLLPPAPARPALPPGKAPSEPSLSQLLRDLVQDGQTLVRQEMELARLEIQRSAGRLARQSAFIAAGGFLIALGLLVLLVFVIIGLGALLGDRYWLSTLIVGILLCGGGIVVAKKGQGGLKTDTLRPAETLESLRDTGEWARAEATEMKRDLTEPQRERL